MDDEPPSFGIARRHQSLISRLAISELWIVLILGPRHDHFAWLDERDHVVDVLVSFVLIDAMRYPNDFLNTEEITEDFFDLGFAEGWIAAPGEQASFRCDERAFAIDSNATAFENEGRQIIGEQFHPLRNDCRQAVIVFVIAVKPVEITTPSIETEVDRTKRFSIGDEERHVVASPSIVIANRDRLDVRNHSKDGREFLIKRGVDANHDFFMLSNRLDDVGESFLSRHRFLAPSILTVRHEHDSRFVGQTFERKVIAIRARNGLAILVIVLKTFLVQRITAPFCGIHHFVLVLISRKEFNANILVMLDPVDQFFGPDFARNNERNSWRIHHDLFFGNRTVALFDWNDFARSVEGNPGTNQHEWERIVEMMIGVGDIRMVMVFGDIPQSIKEMLNMLRLGANGKDA